MYVTLSVCAVPAEAKNDNPSELEVEVVMSCLMWVLRTELWFSERPVHVINS